MLANVKITVSINCTFVRYTGMPGFHNYFTSQTHQIIWLSYVGRFFIPYRITENTVCVSVVIIFSNSYLSLPLCTLFCAVYLDNSELQVIITLNKSP
jgi:hypothetical protein